jgi:hypothetical protein
VVEVLAGGLAAGVNPRNPQEMIPNPITSRGMIFITEDFDIIIQALPPLAVNG